MADRGHWTASYFVLHVEWFSVISPCNVASEGCRTFLSPVASHTSSDTFLSLARPVLHLSADVIASLAGYNWLSTKSSLLVSTWQPLAVCPCQPQSSQTNANANEQSFVKCYRLFGVKSPFFPPRPIHLD